MVGTEKGLTSTLIKLEPDVWLDNTDRNLFPFCYCFCFAVLPSLLSIGLTSEDKFITACHTLVKTSNHYFFTP